MAYSVMILPGTAIDIVKSRPPVGRNLVAGLNVFMPPSSPSSSVLLLCLLSVRDSDVGWLREVIQPGSGISCEDAPSLKG